MLKVMKKIRQERILGDRVWGDLNQMICKFLFNNFMILYFSECCDKAVELYSVSNCEFQKYFEL